MNADEKLFNKLVKLSKKNGIDWLIEMQERQNIEVAEMIYNYVTQLPKDEVNEAKPYAGLNLSLNSVTVTKISESDDNVVDAEDRSEFPSEPDTNDFILTEPTSDEVIDKPEPTKGEGFVAPDLNVIRDEYQAARVPTAIVTIMITKPCGTKLTINF